MNAQDEAARIVEQATASRMATRILMERRGFESVPVRRWQGNDIVGGPIFGELVGYVWRSRDEG